MESDSNINKGNKNISTSQPSVALALTALLDNTKDEFKPLVAPVLRNLPNEIIIGMAVSLLPNTNINISLIDPNVQLDNINLKIEEKNEKKASDISKNINIQTLTPCNVFNSLLTSTSIAVTNTGNKYGLTEKKIPVNVKVYPRLSDRASNTAKKIFSSIKNNKNKILTKIKSRKHVLDKKIMNDAKIEANSFLTDKRLNDINSINNRIKSLINHKILKTSIIKENILLHLNHEDHIQKIINNIINLSF
jgi:hypothetical protein